MDADVPQLDGYRFVYVLPLSPSRVLVEDTYFSDSSKLDGEALRRRGLAYAAAHGLHPARVIREERGVLPLPSRLAAAPGDERPIVAGYQGGWFHPTTGYSLPAAVRLAEVIARLDVAQPESDANRAALRALARAHRAQARFFTRLNRMLFGWFAPDDRWQVLARFYALPDDVIGRFYAMTTTRADRARIVCGRPPRGLSLRRAMAHGWST
jgi:lycopene beta-cyclase